MIRGTLVTSVLLLLTAALPLTVLAADEAEQTEQEGLEKQEDDEQFRSGFTIFDPETITDNAIYVLGENGLPSTGIPHVLVNGVIMVKDSKVQDGVFPGQPIRYPVEKKGRWVPLKRESYLENLFAPEVSIWTDELAPPDAPE